MTRPKLPKSVENQVLVQCRRRCCVCFGLARDLSIKAGQIAHLDRRPANNALDNLAFLCLDHHDQYDSTTSQSKGLTALEVLTFRKELHQAIDTAWTQAIRLDVQVLPDEWDLAGHYVRETAFESSEFQIIRLIDGRLRVTGMSFWGTTRPSGPSIGELDFEALPLGDSVRFSTATANGEVYEVELIFNAIGLVAAEKSVPGHFGMNVSFAGEYHRLAAAV